MIQSLSLFFSLDLTTSEQHVLLLAPTQMHCSRHRWDFFYMRVRTVVNNS